MKSVEVGNVILKSHQVDIQHQLCRLDVEHGHGNKETVKLYSTVLLLDVI